MRSRKTLQQIGGEASKCAWVGGVRGAGSLQPAARGRRPGCHSGRGEPDRALRAAKLQDALTEPREAQQLVSQRPQVTTMAGQKPTHTLV
jgi:hypothetical protein